MFGFSFTSERTINSIKTAIACVIALFVAQFPLLPMGQWVLISVVVVMSGQAHVGGALQKAYMRIIGTISGALVAGLTLYFFKENELAILIVIFFSCGIFAYIASMGGQAAAGAGTLGSVTVILVLLNKSPDISLAIYRPVEIIIGIMIALVVTTFIFPIRATTLLKRDLSSLLNDLRILLQEAVEIKKEAAPMVISQVLEEKVLKSFTAQRALLVEAKSEHSSKLEKSLLLEIMQQERRIYRAILLLNYSLHSNVQADNFLHHLPSFKPAIQNCVEQLTTLEAHLKEVNTKSTLTLETISVDACFTLQGEIHQSLLASSEPVEVYNNAFLVAIKLLTDELNQLTLIINKLYSHHS